MQGNFRPEKSVPEKVYVPAKTSKVLLPQKKVSNLLLGTRGLGAGMSAGLKKLMWVAKTQQKQFYTTEALAPSVYAARRPVCYNLSSRVEYAFIPKLRSIRSRTAHMGPAFLPVPTMWSQYRKFMFMCFFLLLRFTRRLQSSSFWGSILESLTKKGDTQKGTTLEPLGIASKPYPPNPEPQKLQAQHLSGWQVHCRK